MGGMKTLLVFVHILLLTVPMEFSAAQKRKIHASKGDFYSINVILYYSSACGASTPHPIRSPPLDSVGALPSHKPPRSPLSTLLSALTPIRPKNKFVSFQENGPKIGSVGRIFFSLSMVLSYAN